MLVSEPKDLIFHQELEDGTFMAIRKGDELNIGRYDVNKGLEQKIQISNPNTDPALIADITELHTENDHSSFHSPPEIGPGETITATIKVQSSDMVTLENLKTDSMTSYDRLTGDVHYSTS